MNLQQVRYFLVLCEEQNFSRAARRCGISQPSLTNAIKALEDELGGPLFHRKPQTRLSELGRILRPHLRSVHKAADKARNIAADLNGHAFRHSRHAAGRASRNGRGPSGADSRLSRPRGLTRDSNGGLRPS